MFENLILGDIVYKGPLKSFTIRPCCDTESAVKESELKDSV